MSNKVAYTFVLAAALMSSDAVATPPHVNAAFFQSGTLAYNDNGDVVKRAEVKPTPVIDLGNSNETVGKVSAARNSVSNKALMILVKGPRDRPDAKTQDMMNTIDRATFNAATDVRSSSYRQRIGIVKCGSNVPGIVLYVNGKPVHEIRSLNHTTSEAGLRAQIEKALEDEYDANKSLLIAANTPATPKQDNTLPGNADAPRLAKNN